MTYEEAVKEFGELKEWSRNPGEVMLWTAPVNTFGIHLFSFDDGKTVHCVFGPGKNELTPEQVDTFKRENSIMANFYLACKGS